MEASRPKRGEVETRTAPDLLATEDRRIRGRIRDRMRGPIRGRVRDRNSDGGGGSIDAGPPGSGPAEPLPRLVGDLGLQATAADPVGEELPAARVREPKEEVFRASQDG